MDVRLIKISQVAGMDVWRYRFFLRVVECLEARRTISWQECAWHCAYHPSKIVIGTEGLPDHGDYFDPLASFCWSRKMFMTSHAVTNIWFVALLRLYSASSPTDTAENGLLYSTSSSSPCLNSGLVSSIPSRSSSQFAPSSVLEWVVSGVLLHLLLLRISQLKLVVWHLVFFSKGML